MGSRASLWLAILAALGWAVDGGAEVGVQARLDRARLGVGERVGRQVAVGGAVELEVAAAAVGTVAPAGSAALLADVEPREPWVGQLVVLRVRLVLGQDLAEEPRYVPPVTTGFWAEAPSRPESYYATQAGRRVLITETRTRLYPLAPGLASIGAAGAGVVLQSAADPLRWATGQPRRGLTLHSQPIDVHIRALPAGAPPGFDGAVGSFGVTWSADRVRSSQDVPIGVRLDVRGTGNLPLLKTPVLTSSGGDVFAGAVDDSLPGSGGPGVGRRRFQWTVLPHQVGRVVIAAPAFAWFDATAGAYRSAGPPPVTVDVGPPVFSSGHDREAFPAIFLRDAPDPFARGVVPWVWALAGLLAGGAGVLWRVRPARDPHAEARARAAGWRNALRAPGGPAFWRAAEEAAEWLGRCGRTVGAVQAQIAATRYGGGEADVDAVRLRLGKELAEALPARPGLRPARPAAVVLFAVGVALVAASGLQFGESARSLRLQAADRVARDGDVARARSAWLGMWQEGARAQALAARLAWAEMTRGASGPATVWVLRGEQGDARDPALTWVAGLVREAGGLVGARPVRLPLRRGEWALLALALGLTGGVLWPRRLALLAVGVLVLVAAGMEPAQDLWAAHVAQAVVARNVVLQGAGLELETGQVVEVLRREGDAARVRVGRDLEGRVPVGVLLPVEVAK